MDICSTKLNLNPSTFPVPARRSLSNNINFISCRATSADTMEARTSSSNNNLYQVLSLDSDKVGLDEIKKAYRSMARKYHPDLAPVSKKEEYTKKFVELQKAYDTLSDPVSRRKYDLFSCGIQTQETNFSRQTWEEQLLGLQIRSNTPKHARTRTRRAYF